MIHNDSVCPPCYRGGLFVALYAQFVPYGPRYQFSNTAGGLVVIRRFF